MAESGRDDTRHLARGGLLALLAGVTLGMLGPFGTFPDLTAVERYAYWIGLTFLMWAQVVAALAALRRWAILAALPIWGQAALAALVGAVPTTFEVAWVESLLRVGRPLSPASLLETYGGVALVAVVVCVPLELLRRGKPPWPNTSAATPDAFLDRIPAKLGRRILALATEDHYLRVHTDRGEDLVLCTLAQAMAELGDAGVRTHRSWWVSRSAVEGFERDGDRTTLILPRGLRVPVSRSYLVGVREAGLLRD